jgi:hypothetical protein
MTGRNPKYSSRLLRFLVTARCRPRIQSVIAALYLASEISSNEYPRALKIGGAITFPIDMLDTFSWKSDIDVPIECGSRYGDYLCGVAH